MGTFYVFYHAGSRSDSVPKSRRRLAIFAQGEHVTLSGKGSAQSKGTIPKDTEVEYVRDIPGGFHDVKIVSIPDGTPTTWKIGDRATLLEADLAKVYYQDYSERNIV